MTKKGKDLVVTQQEANCLGSALMEVANRSTELADLLRSGCDCLCAGGAIRVEEGKPNRVEEGEPKKKPAKKG